MSKTTILALILAAPASCLAGELKVAPESMAARSAPLAAALSEVSEAREGTDQYHEVGSALADGFLSTFACVQVPGLGAMGIHYVNPARMLDGVVSAAEPETLLYLPDRHGNLKLVGVEYFQPVFSNGQPYFGSAPPAVVDNPAPVLFGQEFDGPEPGHGPGQPWHYELHAWIWKHNPRGMFFPFNPKLSCP